MPARPTDYDDPNGKHRDCLCCGTNFWSTWNGNRICTKCKQTREWKDAWENADYSHGTDIIDRETF